MHNAIPGNDASILCDNGNKITISKSKALQKLNRKELVASND